jgi:predicted acyltransferase
MFLHFSKRKQFLITAIILIGYWALMTFVPVPEIGEANLGKDTNLGAWLDRLLLQRHLWSHSKTWDPEGVLSSLPAIASGMIGVLSGYLIKQNIEPRVKMLRLLVLGGILIVAGLAWNIIFPINKNLWTSSYVCFTAGIAMVLLSVIYYFLDIRGYRKGVQPFIYFGSNAITIYVASEAIAKAFYLITFEQNYKSIDLKSLIFSKFNVPWLGPYNASLLLALIWVLIFWVVAREMYRRKIFIKV